MNKQRKVLITITYNEMGIIIDTKAEEVAQPNLQQTCNQLATDCISRQAAIDAISDALKRVFVENEDIAKKIIGKLPSAQPEQRWIPVTERLPEDEEKEYLVTILDREDCVCEVYKGFYSDGKWWTQWCHGCLALNEEPCGDNVVIAWMPLPEPYRAGRRKMSEFREYIVRISDDDIERFEMLYGTDGEIIHCRECEYGEQDSDGDWSCSNFGGVVGDIDGSGYCADAERREDG